MDYPPPIGDLLKKWDPLLVSIGAMDGEVLQRHEIHLGALPWFRLQDP